MPMARLIFLMYFKSWHIVQGGHVDIIVSRADVNADGRADIHDALLIMQYLAGWNVTLK